MTYSSVDLQAGVEEQLQLLGFNVVGDDERGWGYAFGAGSQARALASNLDTAAEATAAALTDLATRVETLRCAASEVVARQGQGDLAAAVRALDRAAGQLDPLHDGGTTSADRSDALELRLRELRRAGATLEDCIRIFGVLTEQDPWARRAFVERHVNGDLELGSHTVVSESNDGAYVLCWVWVETPGEQASSG